MRKERSHRTISSYPNWALCTQWTKHKKAFWEVSITYIIAAHNQTNVVSHISLLPPCSVYQKYNDSVSWLKWTDWSRICNQSANPAFIKNNRSKTTPLGIDSRAVCGAFFVTKVQHLCLVLESLIVGKHTLTHTQNMSINNMSHLCNLNSMVSHCTSKKVPKPSFL